jgi:hypothetical protein
VLYCRPAEVSAPSARPFSEPSSSPFPSPPGWARGLDVLCLVLVLLALIVAVGGGFRESIGGVRVAVTSPLRLLIAAAVVSFIRHAAAPHPSILRDMPRRLAALWTPEARMAWRVLLGTRAAMLFIGYFAVLTFGFGTGDQPPLRYAENELLNLQARWDTMWYLGVVLDGYSPLSGDHAAQQNIVFFPALPMAIRVVGRLFGGSAPAFLWGGTLVVLCAFFWSLIYVYRLARDLLDNEDQASWAVWALAAYPFAVFFGALYSESFFLLGSAGAFYHFRRREFLKAALWGLFVGLTRPNGCFLSLPLGLLGILAWLPPWAHGGSLSAPGRTSRDGVARDSRTLLPALASAAAPGLGVLTYSAFVWRLTGDPLAWAEGHAAWGRQYSGLWPLLVKYYGYFAESGAYIVSVTLPFDMLNALGALFVIATAVPVWRRFGLPFALFILVNILPPLAAGGLLSTGRFSAVLFPAFLWLASVVPARQRPGWVGSFMAVQALNAALFYTWREMF